MEDERRPLDKPVVEVHRPQREEDEDGRSGSAEIDGRDGRLEGENLSLVTGPIRCWEER